MYLFLQCANFILFFSIFMIQFIHVFIDKNLNDAKRLHSFKNYMSIEIILHRKKIIFYPAYRSTNEILIQHLY